MGVWSSISFWHFGKRNGESLSKPSISRNSTPKHILNVDPDRFSNNLHQDIKEFRIQESFPEISKETSLPNTGDEEQQNCLSSFEYSMGGNLKFYKKHLKQDYFETKISHARYLRHERKISHSDNDSDPESLRYSRKYLAPSNDDVIAEEHDVELSFDDYSTIYEPEFLLNVKPQPMVQETTNPTLDTRQTNETRQKRKTKENKKNTAASFENGLSPWSKEPLTTGYDVKEQPVFDYYASIGERETSKNDELIQKQNSISSHNELVSEKKKIVRLKTEKKCKFRQSSKISNKKNEESHLRTSKNIPEASQTIHVNVEENCKKHLSLRLHDKYINDIGDDSGWNGEVKMKHNAKVEEDKDVTEFYPESPVAEINFFKTPCSTRHNSLEILTDMKEDSEESSDKEKHQLNEDASPPSSQLQESYNKLPKEFQEMAKRLAKKDEFPKSRLWLYQVSSIQNFSCSSSTCSTMSPRSPNARTISRTPSYKMPKTPSLSRHHPATYVTQHTSSRSRPPSRASSRAPSPTRENSERSSIKHFIEYTLKRERDWKPIPIDFTKDTSAKENIQSNMVGNMRVPQKKESLKIMAE